jgi:hypothetical protein
MVLSPVRMVELVGGFRIPRALYAVAAPGSADQLVAAAVSAKILTERSGTRKHSLHRLVRTLASMGVFTEPEPGVLP